MKFSQLWLLFVAGLISMAPVCGAARADELPQQVTVATGLVNPESAALGFDGRIYASAIGERDKAGDGQIVAISGKTVVPFATGLDDPKGVVAVYDRLYVADRKQVWKIDRDGHAEVFAAAGAFPIEPIFLNDICADPLGDLYVSDSGDRATMTGGKVFRISREGKVSVYFDAKNTPEIKRPNGVLMGRDKRLLMADFGTGVLYRLPFPFEGAALEKVAEGLGSPDGIVEDAAGNLFVSDYMGGKVFRILRGTPQPVQIAEGYGNAADLCLGPSGKDLFVPDMKNGTVVKLPIAPEVAFAPMLEGLKNPESIVRKEDGTYLISVIGEFQKDGDGSIVSFTPGKPPVTVAKGLDDPKGIVLKGNDLYVADNLRVLKIDKSGKVSVFAAAEAFPRRPVFLNDIAVDDAGDFYVSDSGDLKGNQGAVFKITADGKASLVIAGDTTPLLKGPNGVLPDGKEYLLVADFFSGDLLRVKLADKSVTKIAGGMPGGDGLTFDFDGNLYISQWSTGKVSVLTPGSKEPRLLSNQFTSAADTCLDPKNGRLMVPDMKSGTVTGLPLLSGVPTDVDATPLPVRIEQVFKDVSIDRPIVLTHAGDGTNRIFIAGQRGKVYVLPNDPKSDDAKVFFDLSKKVDYTDKQNEEGFLGFAFHPKYKQNGEFFVYYTSTVAPHLSVVSRFKVDPKNPNFADPATEEELMRIPQPYWNHNGGTICFGPDGYLYIGLGDGGSRDDPEKNGQNLNTLLGSILRIDVDSKSGDKKYAVPADNPFVGQKNTQPEIWAYGVRNIWRMSFDRKTGDFWAADVGQDIWEEINVVKKGGNYGWNPREAMHRFQAGGSGPKPEYLEPIWEYHHDIGKSVTGGHVYRGQRVPELAGHYIYADYVTGRVWGLQYDTAAKRVQANRPIFGNNAPVMSFGEDEQGDIYFLTVNGGVFRFASIPTAK